MTSPHPSQLRLPLDPTLPSTCACGRLQPATGSLVEVRRGRSAPASSLVTTYRIFLADRRLADTDRSAGGGDNVPARAVRQT